MQAKRIALVTGGNKGIGFAIAQGLGQQGHAVWLGCRDTARGEAAAARLREAGITARAVLMDVTDTDSGRRRRADRA
ncbi:SDR family NAD(P)-dependent oxidoreductase [Cereibacter sp. SYSU M97828]|nr:SDR family NAD(P)-dependent oxidoreductase [Cereibacter flavus]